MSDEFDLDGIAEKGRKKDKTFAEVEGVPANAARRKKIKEQKQAGPTEDKRKVFYTMNGNKFVRAVVKANGNFYFDRYMGRLKSKLGPAEQKAEAAKWELEKKQWAKEGPFIYPHEVPAKVAEFIAELNKG